MENNSYDFSSDSFKEKVVLITGGTGSIGTALTKKLLETTKIKKLIVFSRDELKQADLASKINDPRIRFFLGDVRDKNRLNLAFYGIDYVIHAAALKRVEAGEYNPIEFVKTNVIGSQNVIEAAIEMRVKNVIALSTDKASSPVNLYGATKLTADKLFIAANSYGIPRGTKFSVVRYGNVMGSRGSVIPFFTKLVEEGKPLPITDVKMTRFWITLDQATCFILDSFQIMQGGELFVPIIPSMKIVDLAMALSGNSNFVNVGTRPGEKIHEEMISASEIQRTFKTKNRYVVLPETEANFSSNYEKVLDMQSYSSNNNDFWLTKNDISDYLNANPKSF
jgi:UDP-N-acetylglucosamine 4,6-dehydratase